MRVGVGASIRLTAHERPPRDPLVQGYLDIQESLRAGTGEDARPEAMTLPIRLEDREAVKVHHLGEAIGSDLEDALRVMFGLKGPCRVHEEPGKAPVVKGGRRSWRRQWGEFDRRAQRVAALTEHADLAALKPRNRDTLVRGFAQ